MPVFTSMDIPKPSNWQDFEDISCAAFAQTWASPMLQKNGRSGQKQKGVDIWGPDHLGRPVAIQCKNTSQGLTYKTVLDEIEKANDFSGQISTLYLATSAEHDAVLQERLRVLTEERVGKNLFPVAALFWDDVVRALSLNPSVLKSFYPQITLIEPSPNVGHRLIAALEMGYYGGDLKAFLDLVFGEAGWMSQTDPEVFISKIRVVAARARQLFSEQDASPIVEALDEVLAGCAATKEQSSDWDHADVWSERASLRIRDGASLLSPAEENVLLLGARLSRIYHHVNDCPNAEVRGEIEVALRSVLPEDSSEVISHKMERAQAASYGYNWAVEVYSLIDHELRYRS
jgi:hypothetical protein